MPNTDKPALQRRFSSPSLDIKVIEKQQNNIDKFNYSENSLDACILTPVPLNLAAHTKKKKIMKTTKKSFGTQIKERKENYKDILPFNFDLKSKKKEIIKTIENIEINLKSFKYEDHPVFYSTKLDNQTIFYFNNISLDSKNYLHKINLSTALNTFLYSKKLINFNFDNKKLVFQINHKKETYYLDLMPNKNTWEARLNYFDKSPSYFIRKKIKKLLNLTELKTSKINHKYSFIYRRPSLTSEDGLFYKKVSDTDLPSVTKLDITLLSNYTIKDIYENFNAMKNEYLKQKMDYLKLKRGNQYQQKKILASKKFITDLALHLKENKPWFLFLRCDKTAVAYRALEKKLDTEMSTWLEKKTLNYKPVKLRLSEELKNKPLNAHIVMQSLPSLKQRARYRHVWDTFYPLIQPTGNHRAALHNLAYSAAKTMH